MVDPEQILINLVDQLYPMAPSSVIETAIANATGQIRQQQRERVEMLTMLLEDMTELHAEDCKEDECCNILAVSKYLKELEAE